MLPRDEYLKSLPRKRVACGALFFNKKGDMLVLKPNYKDHWTVPGGTSEASESPLETVVRETKEEIGLDRKIEWLLGIDYKNSNVENDESLQMFFYGGTLLDKEILEIKLQAEELEEFIFAPADKCLELLGPRWELRLPKLLEAIKTGRTILVETRE